jgi:hypothetical protein
MEEAKQYTILVTNGRTEFIGWHLPQLEKNNWHYYEDIDGIKYHFRKEHMVCVTEKKI